MQVEFVTSAPDLDGRPARVLPEIACYGRSNCGKSSLINALLGRKRLAHTSGQPGKTQLLNYFLVDDRYYVVDLPGYGYARVSRRQRERWQRLLRLYLAANDRPVALLHLLDVRHAPSPDDVEVAGWILDSGHPFAVVPTKIDKVGRPRRLGRYRELIAGLALPPETPFLPTSAVTGEGIREVRAWIAALLEAAEADGVEML